MSTKDCYYLNKVETTEGVLVLCDRCLAQLPDVVVVYGVECLVDPWRVCQNCNLQEVGREDLRDGSQ